MSTPGSGPDDRPGDEPTPPPWDAPPQPPAWDRPEAQPGGEPYGGPGYGAPGYGAPGYGAPGYGAPPPGAPGYGPPPYGAPGWDPPPGYPAFQPPQQTDGKAVTALVLAISSWVLCPVIPAIIALVLASSSQRDIVASGGRLGGEGLNKAARIISWINLALAGVAIAALLLLIAVAGTASVETTTY